jgi:hypothetical protein
MRFIKKIDKLEDFTKIYFVDEMGRKQGRLECYDTSQNVLPRENNLYFIEEYKDDILERREGIGCRLENMKTSDHRFCT